MNTMLERLIDQLNTLIPFIALSRERVFNILNDNRAVWFSDEQEALPRAYALYRKQINHSAFLLGYSFFESFLIDLLSAILRNRPAMLPKNRKLDYDKIIRSNSKDEILETMIKREIHELLQNPMADIVQELRNRYNFSITESQRESLCRAKLLRNCVIHNSSRADSGLAVYDGFEENEEFELDAGTVHEYGIEIRRLARSMYSEAQRNHQIGL